MTYTIFHVKELVLISTSKEFSPFSSCEKVASFVLEGNRSLEHLEKIFEATNHIENSWTERGTPGLTVFPKTVRYRSSRISLEHRSTSVGDIVVCEDSLQVFRVEGSGWSIGVLSSVSWKSGLPIVDSIPANEETLLRSAKILSSEKRRKFTITSNV